MSRTSELLNNTLLFSISSFSSRLLTFLMVPLYTTVLSTEDYGISDLISTTISFMLPIGTLCISEAVLRFTIDNLEDKQKTISVGIGVCIISTLIVTALTPVLNLLLKVGDYSWFIPLFYFTSSVSGVFSKYARAIDKVRSSAVAGVMHTFATVALNILLLVVFKFGIWGYLSSLVLGNIVQIVYLFVSCKIAYDFKWSLLFNGCLELYSYSAPLIPNSMSWWLIDYANRYVIRFYMGLPAIGIFAAANKIPTILTVVSSIFMDAWLLSVLKEYNKEGGKDYIKKAYVTFSIVLMGFSFVLIICSQFLAMLLLKGDFYTGWIYIPILICSSYYGALSGFIGALYSAEKCTSQYFKTTVYGGIVSIVISIAFIRLIGLYSVVIGMGLGYIIIWLVRLYTTKKYINLEVNVTQELISNFMMWLCVICTIKEWYVLELVVFLTFMVLNRKSAYVFLKIIKNYKRKN